MSREYPAGGPNEPLFLVPWQVPAFAGVFLACQAVLALGPVEWASWAYSHLQLVPLRFKDPDQLGEALPTLLTHAFLHAGWVHVLINATLLMAAAGPVLRNCGVVRLWVFFLVCVAAGGIAHVLVYWGSPEPVVGASGGAAGLIAAAFRYRTRQLSRGEIVAPISREPVWIFTVFWIGINLLFFVWDQLGGGVMSGMATIAHIGGYLAGLFLAPVFVRGARPKTWPRRA